MKISDKDVFWILLSDLPVAIKTYPKSVVKKLLSESQLSTCCKRRIIKIRATPKEHRQIEKMYADKMTFKAK